jgi:5-deoxy-glucuronate isomerase
MTIPAGEGEPGPGTGRGTPARSLLRRAAARDASGLVCAIDPATAGWDWVTFHVYELAPGQGVARSADDQERVALVLEGHARVRAGDRDLGLVGSRTSVFDGPPAPVVLVEPGLAVSVVAETAALVAIAAAPGGSIGRTALIGPDEILVEARGEGSTARRIHHLLPPSTEAGRLIVFEAYTPGGNWSSYPPHKHDTEDPPTEARLEELYYYRFAKPQGFAFARVYTADRSLDEAMTPMTGDVVLVPEGYHPVGVPAGYDCWYLNVMAGPNRAWYFTVDPDHAWLMNWSPSAPRAADERG